MALGIAMLVVGSHLWLSVDKSRPHSRVTIRSATTTVKPAARASKSRPRKTRVFATKTTKRIRPRESERSRRSETVVGSLLVLGTLLLLTGAFFGRISELTLPGGGGLKFFPVPTVPPKTQATIAGVLAASPDLSPAKGELVYLAAVSDAASKIQERAIEAAATGEPLTPTLPTSVVQELTLEKIDEVQS